jgi:hypothetical protein
MLWWILIFWLCFGRVDAKTTLWRAHQVSLQLQESISLPLFTTQIITFSLVQHSDWEIVRTILQYIGSSSLLPFVSPQSHYLFLFAHILLLRRQSCPIWLKTLIFKQSSKRASWLLVLQAWTKHWPRYLANLTRSRNKQAPKQRQKEELTSECAYCKEHVPRAYIRDMTFWSVLKTGLAERGKITEAVLLCDCVTMRLWIALSYSHVCFASQFTRKKFLTQKLHVRFWWKANF